MLMPASTEDPPLIIYQAVSPNNDNQNDYWHIENITFGDRRNNSVKLFNRWGDLVWKGTNYDNNTIVFSGDDKNGNKLLTGTYFYVIEFSSGRKEERGFLSLKR